MTVHDAGQGVSDDGRCARHRDLRLPHLLQRVRRPGPRARSRHLRPKRNGLQTASSTTSSSPSSVTAFTPTRKSGKLDNLYLEGNTSFNNGILSQVSGTDDELPDRRERDARPRVPRRPAKSPRRLPSSTTTATSPDAGGVAANLGYSKGIASPTILDNYLVGGKALALVNAFRPIQMTGNTLDGSIVRLRSLRVSEQQPTSRQDRPASRSSSARISTSRGEPTSPSTTGTASRPSP